MARETFTPAMASSEATIDIGTLAVLQGQLPSRALNLVQEWAMIHREELLDDWRLCRDHEQPNQVEPLQ